MGTRSLPVLGLLLFAMGLALVPLRLSVAQTGAQPGAQQATATLDISVSSKSITLGETVQLLIVAEGDYDKVDVRLAKDWRIVSEGQSQQISMGTGRRRSVKHKYTRVLEPQRTGVLTISAGRLLKNGQVVSQTKPIQIQVRKPVPQKPTTAREASSLKSRSGEMAFIQPRLSSDRVYVGQPVVLEYDLWVKASVSFNVRGYQKEPKFEGFLTTNLLDSRSNVPRRRERLGRDLYNVHTVFRQIVVPLEAGPTTLDEMSLKLAVGQMFNTRNSVAKSRPFVLKVLALPEDGRPAGFRDGQIGQFELEAKAEPTQAGTNERILLTTTVQGKGNLRGVEPPVLPEIDGMSTELLPSGDQPGIVEDRTGVHGELNFTFILTFERPGEYDLADIALPHFDPKRGGFHVAKAKSVKLQIEGSATATASDGTGSSGGLRPLAGWIDTAQDRPPSAGGGPVFWVVLAIPALLFLGAETRYRTARHRDANAGYFRAKGAQSSAERALSASEGKLKSDSAVEFFDSVSRALIGYVDSRFGLTCAGMTRDELRRELARSGAATELVEAFVAELENCDFARFAPSAVRDEEMRQALDRARAVIASLERVAQSTEKGAKDA